MTIDVEALLRNVGCDDRFAFLVHREAKHGEAFGAVLLLHFDEPGDFLAARKATGGPEVDENDFAFVVGETYVLAVEVFEDELGHRHADRFIVLYRGWTGRRLRRFARGFIREIGGNNYCYHYADDHCSFPHRKRSKGLRPPEDHQPDKNDNQQAE